MLTRAEVLRLRSLREKKQREALGLFVIEGEKVVAELLAAGFPFAELYVTAGHRLRPPGSAPSPREIPAADMERISHFPTPSRVLAVGRIERHPLAAGALDRGFTLALDRVQDAGNVGTLLRIADWYGFERVVLSPECADVFHQKVINASMGSFARVRWHSAELAPLLAAIRPAVPVLGCDLEGDSVHTLPPCDAAVVVIGSEGRGLSPEVAATVTRRVTIPRFGRAESLNAAVAAGIVCDNLRRSGLKH